MNDLISRKAAIDALETEDRLEDAATVLGIFENGERMKAINIIRKLPSVEKPWVIDFLNDAAKSPSATITFITEKRWIPVSERLPETIKPVIVTWTNTNPASYYRHIIGEMFTGVGHFCNGKWYWYSSTCEDYLAEYGGYTFGEMDDAIEVRAWMPLPEPYKEDEDDEQ